MAIDTYPLSLRRWSDLEEILNAKGCSVARGCWCMYFRTSGKAPEVPPGQTFGTMSKAALRSLVKSEKVPGLLGYHNGVPVGWVSVGPRSDYLRLERSPVMKPVDDEPVWSVTCFVVPGPLRRQGVARALLSGAVEYAKEQGAQIVEAYPVDKSAGLNSSSWFGSKAMFDEAGFVEVARRKPSRPVVRLSI